VAINLASGTPRRIGDLLTTLIAQAGVNPEVRVVDPALLRPTDLPVTHGDTARARALIGWTPTCRGS